MLALLQVKRIRSTFQVYLPQKMTKQRKSQHISFSKENNVT